MAEAPTPCPTPRSRPTPPASTPDPRARTSSPPSASRSSADLPSDWFTRAAARGGERVVIAETGWLATQAVGLLGEDCVAALVQDADNQAAYFDRVIADANAHAMDLVTWWSNCDVVPAAVMIDCPCDFDADWCAVVDVFRAAGGVEPRQQFYGEMLLKLFGTMGIRDHAGAPRLPIFDRWRAARELPVR